MEDYTLVERPPSVEEYQRLRDSTDWDPLDDEVVEKGLQNTLFSVCAVIHDEVIGCGRIIGDGSMYFYIQDVIVLPQFQGRGIGTHIMSALLDYLKTHAKNNSFIGLMAAKGTSGFYERHGFKRRPPDAPGMFLIWRHDG